MRAMVSRLYVLMLLLAAAAVPAAEMPVLHVVVTQRAPVVDRLVRAVEAELATRVRVDITDRKGSMHGAESLVGALAQSLGEGDLVLALGAPAARLSTRIVRQHPVVCAMTNAGSVPVQPRDAGRIHFADVDPSVTSLVEALGNVWKVAGRIAVISAEDAGDVAPAAVGPAKVLWTRVRPEADLVQVLDGLENSVDGFVFPREATVLNRRNLDLVTQWLARHGKPAIGYSRFLVTAGFPAALGSDDASSRRR